MITLISMTIKIIIKRINNILNLLVKTIKECIEDVTYFLTLKHSKHRKESKIRQKFVTLKITSILS